MRKRLKAFTLVEMLIVMGIIIILMAVGIASGRFAIRRANRIEHQNAAENIYQAMQSYYTDNREYPCKSVETGVTCNAQYLVGTVLDPYIDDFDGGSEATFMYMVTDTTGAQEAIVCVTYGGAGDQNQLGMYCTGNAVGTDDAVYPGLKDMEYGAAEYDVAVALFDSASNCSDWDPALDSPWTTCTEPTSSSYGY